MKFISAVSSFSVVVQDVHLIVTAADCSGVSVSPLQKIKVEKHKKVTMKSFTLPAILYLLFSIVPSSLCYTKNLYTKGK